MLGIIIVQPSAGASSSYQERAGGECPHSPRRYISTESAASGPVCCRRVPRRLRSCQESVRATDLTGLLLTATPSVCVCVCVCVCVYRCSYAVAGRIWRWSQRSREHCTSSGQLGNLLGETKSGRGRRRGRQRGREGEGETKSGRGRGRGRQRGREGEGEGETKRQGGGGGDKEAGRGRQRVGGGGGGGDKEAGSEGEGETKRQRGGGRMGWLSAM